MSVLVAAFDSPDALIAAANRLQAEGFPAQDLLTPFPIDGADAALGLPPSPLRKHMAIAGFGAAAVAYGLEWFSAAVAYPYISGGRPFNSWPVFLLVPFEVGVLVAGIAGFVTFLVTCGLPRLHDPIFAAQGIERASLDRFFLTTGVAPDKATQSRLRALLEHEGAISIEEVQR